MAPLTRQQTDITFFKKMLKICELYLKVNFLLSFFVFLFFNNAEQMHYFGQVEILQLLLFDYVTVLEIFFLSNSSGCITL